MIDENRMITAPMLLKNKEDIPKITKNYVILENQTLTGSTWDDMIQAINVMSEHGWKCINISTMHNTSGIKSSHCYALMEKIKSVEDKIGKEELDPRIHVIPSKEP